MGLTKTVFGKQIRQALENLHDFAYLQSLPLTSALANCGQTPDQSIRELRSELLAAIEQLNPSADLSPRARERRPYVLLYGRYVQGMSTTELVEEMAISVRQLRREHKRALAAVTDLLWRRLSGRLAIESPPSASLEPPLPTAQATAEFEADQLIRQARMESLALQTVVNGVLSVLAPVAKRRRLSLRHQLPDDLPAVHADRIVLRQALLELVSYAMGRASAGDVIIDGTPGRRVSLHVRVRTPGCVQAAGAIWPDGSTGWSRR